MPASTELTYLCRYRRGEAAARVCRAYLEARGRTDLACAALGISRRSLERAVVSLGLGEWLEGIRREAGWIAPGAPRRG